MILLQIDWNPAPEIFKIGSFAIRYYSLMFVFAFMLGLFLMKKIFIEDRISIEKLDSLFIYMVIAILIGARLGHFLFYDPEFLIRKPLEVILPFRFSPKFEFTGFAGLASHGAAIGIITALYFYSKKVLKEPLLYILDRVAIPVAIAGVLSSLVLGGLAGWAAYEGSYNLLKTLGLRDDDPELKKQGYNEGGKVRKKPSRKLKKKKRTLNINRIRKPSYRPIPSAPQGDIENKDGKPNKAWWDFLGWAGTSDGNVQLAGSGANLGKRVSEVGNTLGKNDYFGPLLSLTSKIILNKP